MTDAEDHPQMTLSEATTPDLALCYMLQTHLCYSYIEPDELAFRVLKQRLDSTPFALSPSAGREGLDAERLDAERLAKAMTAWWMETHAEPRETFVAEKWADGAAEIVAREYAALSPTSPPSEEAET